VSTWLPAGRLLRSHSLAGQGSRYLIAGGFVAFVALAVTTVLAEVVGLPFELALPIGSLVSVSLHFSLQRVFVWAHHEEFALPLRHQLPRYLALVAVQYTITALSIALLPGALGVPTEAVYLGTVLVLGSTNFLLFRHVIFHRGERGWDPPSAGVDSPRSPAPTPTPPSE
jgi:putative flippase GtrA